MLRSGFIKRFLKFAKGINMKEYAKNRPAKFCAAIFALCLLARFLEYFVINTDKTALGENVLHKIFGIAILAIVLNKTGSKWSDIGFRKNGSLLNIFNGLLLGTVCFAFSYCVELAILAVQGTPAHLELYISGFSLTGSKIKNTGPLFFTLCVLLNIINVWMEEGIFRGLFIKVLSNKKTFMGANFIAAALFGLWHIAMPIGSYIDGEMSFDVMFPMCIGYMVLSGIMGVKWGLLQYMTGSLWMGFGDHLFNNTVATNMLHVVSANGADELQIVRVVLSQIISFAFVSVLYRYKKRTVF